MSYGHSLDGVDRVHLCPPGVVGSAPGILHDQRQWFACVIATKFQVVDQHQVTCLVIVREGLGPRCVDMTKATRRKLNGLRIVGCEAVSEVLTDGAASVLLEYTQCIMFWSCFG